MKIKKWIIGIFSIIVAEAVLIFILSAALPASMAASGNRGPVLQATALLPSDGQDISRSDGRTDWQSGANQSDNGAKDPTSRKNRKIKTIYRKNKQNLILVNRAHKVSESYDASLKPICYGRLYASERLYDSLTKMLSDAQQQGYRYWIASAWRSSQKQQRLVDEDVQAAMKKGLSYQEALRQTYQETMPAGHSEHETGLALDILCSENTRMDISQAEEAANQWLRENSYRYGFILRYPKDKEAITGISYEPWHFRYVGKRAAAYMTKHHMTLEEFWEQLHELR